MKENEPVFCLTFDNANPNISCTWQEKGITYNKEITRKAFLSCLQDAFTEEGLQTGLLPPNCISYARSTKGVEQVVLLQEMGYADITYYKSRYEHFPLPRMVFAFTFTRGARVNTVRLGIVEQGTLRSSSQMYKYPFSNVGNDGRLCLGCNVMPKCEDLYTLGSLPHLITAMPNNDDHYITANNKQKLAFRALLEAMKNKSPGAYYEDVLVPSGKTLQDFLTNK